MAKFKKQGQTLGQTYQMIQLLPGGNDINEVDSHIW